MIAIFLLILISFVALYLIPKRHERRSQRPATVPPLRLSSGANPFEQFALTNRERDQRVGFLS